MTFSVPTRIYKSTVGRTTNTHSYIAALEIPSNATAHCPRKPVSRFIHHHAPQCLIWLIDRNKRVIRRRNRRAISPARVSRSQRIATRFAQITVSANQARPRTLLSDRVVGPRRSSTEPGTIHRLMVIHIKTAATLSIGQNIAIRPSRCIPSILTNNRLLTRRRARRR